MTRREFFPVMAAGLLSTSRQAPVTLPVRLILDDRAKLGPHQLHFFWAYLWPQAVSELWRCGVHVAASQAPGEIWRPPGREPMVSGLDRGSLNLVITNQIPMEWDSGRGVSGITTWYRGYSLSVVAITRCHGNQVPFLSTNTCLHEMLHALLGDIFDARPGRAAVQAREFRADWYATMLWMLWDGGAVRRAAAAYVARLRTA